MWRNGAEILLCILALSGCVTFREDPSKYVRNGVRYGVTEGRFRGRWWNYYERGRSFSDGGYWTEAERDFRTALAGRANDQLWPRTYGLHFIPEYFPHRELGIALYHQDRTPEAISEIENSLEQKYSARAGYFLDQARKTWVESRQADTAPPSIEVVAPAAPLGQMTAELTGVARDDTFVAKITINGQPYMVASSAPEIPFKQAVPLLAGENRVEVTTEDLTGKQTATVVTVRADLDGPAVSFDSPLVVPGIVRGVAFDASGVDSVLVAGKPAVLSPGEGGGVAFSVELVRDDLTPPLRYEGKDRLGNTTGGELPIDMLLVSHVPPEVVFASDSGAVVPVGTNVNALILNGQVVAFAAADAGGAASGPQVRFGNLAEGQKYLMNEIIVALDVDAPSGLAEVQLNGMPVDTIPGRNVQHLSRRISLAPGRNDVAASARDVVGQLGEANVSIERQLTEVERPDRHLSAAILGNIWKGNSPTLEQATDVILNALERELAHSERFNMVNRGLLPEALTEQELSAALASKDARLALGKAVPAEMMFVGRVRQDLDNTLEIVLEAVSTETSMYVARAEVTGPADTLDALERLVRDLALRTVQEFPLAQGQVALVKDANTFITNLSRAHLIRESMKYVVFRYGEEIKDPVTNASLGRVPEIVSEAIVRSVDAQKSTAEVLRAEEETAKEIRTGDQVVTK